MRYMSHRRRKRFSCRRYLIPVTALSLAAAVLLLHHAGASERMEQSLCQLGGGFSAQISALFRKSHHSLDLPATDSPTMALPDFLPNDLWEYTESDDNADTGASSDSPLPDSEPSDDAVEAVTITGGGNSYDPGRVYIKNLTSYTIDTAALLAAKNPVSISKSDPSLPQVLIVHTHGTEAYTPSGSDQYTASSSYRTLDSSQNVLRIGEEITRILNDRGIGTVHSTKLHDYPAYSGAYSRALADIKDWLNKYPSIKMVIDVHRDALTEGDKVYKTVANMDGADCAQLMFVTGTDGGSLSHPNWEQNAAFQVQLHHQLNTAYPSIMRPMSFRAGRYNQHMTTGSMLVEVGTCGNTLQEALTAARLFAETLADTLLTE